MTQKVEFICTECGSDLLAVSHTWSEHQDYEEVGVVQENGRYAFEPRVALNIIEDNHEWIAYCGGCGHGVAVEWLDEGRIRLLAQGEDRS